MNNGFANATQRAVAELKAENVELRRKLAEQQGICQECHGAGTTDNHVTGEVECGTCSGHGIVVLVDKFAAAKQEGYEQGKQAGRDEVLRELSKRVPVSYLYIYRHPIDGSKTFGSNEPKSSAEYELLETRMLIERPSAPEKGAPK